MNAEQSEAVILIFIITLAGMFLTNVAIQFDEWRLKRKEG